MDPQAVSRQPDVAAEADLAAWLSVDAAARILGKSARTVQLMCNDGRLTARRIPTAGGSLWRIDPSCRTEFRVAVGEVTTPALAGSELAGLPGRHRQLLHKRLGLIEAFRQFMADKPLGWTLARCRQTFVDSWNCQQRIEGGDLIVTPRTLRRLDAAYDAQGLAGLVDRRARNGQGSTMCEELKQFILGLYANEERPTVAYVYEMACAVAERKEWTIPSLRAVQLWIARLDRKVLDCGREPKRHRDRDVPHITRDWSLVPAMGCIVGDHHQFDFYWPRLTYNKLRRRVEWRWHRPWLSGWLDARSWYMYAHTIAFDSPNGDRVMGSFLKGVMAHGAPDTVYLDNGKDYRMYRFAGGRRTPARRDDTIVAQRHVEPILEMFGIGVTWAIPYNARAKVIEPWFRLMEDRFGKRLDTYCGSQPRTRPERLKKLHGHADRYAERFFDEVTYTKITALTDPSDQAQRDELALKALRGMFDRWIQADYHRRKSPARAAAGQTPIQAFIEFRAADFQVRKPAEQDLALLLMPAKAISVRTNGVWVAAFGQPYWSDDLERRRCNTEARMRVVYRYNPDDPSRIYVFDATSDRFLAIATPNPAHGLHPLAAHGSPDAARVSAAIATQRSIAKGNRRAVRTARKHATRLLAETGLAAQQQAGEDLGLVIDTPAATDTPPVVLKLTGELTRAATAAERHDDALDRQAAAEQLLAADATGTDDIVPVANEGHGTWNPLDSWDDGTNKRGMDPRKEPPHWIGRDSQ